jgi:hypothetical protein
VVINILENSLIPSYNCNIEILMGSKIMFYLSFKKMNKRYLLNEKKVCPKYFRFRVRIKKNLGGVLNILENTLIPSFNSKLEILMGSKIMFYQSLYKLYK